MVSEVLKTIRDACDAVVTELKPTVTIKTPIFEAEFDVSALRALRADLDDFGSTFDHCFMRRDVYIASLDKETIGDVQASATEIRDLLDERVEALSGRGGDLGSSRHLLMEWAASARSLGAVLHRRLQTQPPDRWIEDDPPSADAVMSFRTQTLPIIGILICHLEDRTKDRAEKSFADATSLLSAREVVALSKYIKAT
jgi:hypothetical protein